MRKKIGISANLFFKAAFFNYEVDSDTLTNFYEFSLANSIYWGLVEGHASEQAAKRSSMENATKNAGKLLNIYLYARTNIHHFFAQAK